MQDESGASRRGHGNPTARRALKTGTPRMALCAAASLLLHAGILALLPPPRRPGGISEARASLLVRMTGADRRAAAPPAPEAAAAAPRPSADDAAPPKPEKALEGVETAPPAEAEGAAAEGPGEARPPSSGVEAAPLSPAPEDAAAALLLARVDAALAYPEAARRRGTEGVAGFRILLDETGALSELRVIRSSGSSLLDKAAREAVEAGLPLPNPYGVPLAFDLAVRFSLEKKTAAP